MGAPCVDWQDESRDLSQKKKSLAWFRLDPLKDFEHKNSSGFGHLVELAVWCRTCWHCRYVRCFLVLFNKVEMVLNVDSRLCNCMMQHKPCRHAQVQKPLEEESFI